MTDQAARRPTIRDVARAAGVSVATASRAVNGTSTVNKDMARRVAAAVRTTGYVPNAAGRLLRRGGSSEIAVVIPEAENPYFGQVITEVEKMARSHGYAVSVSHTDNDLQMERECFAQLISRQVAGVILTAVDSAATDVSDLVAARVPLVLVDRPLAEGGVDLVATDNRDAGRQAASHLHEQGFLRPAVIAGPATLSTTEDRARGFGARWREFGVELPESSVRRGDLGVDSGGAAMREILEATDADCVFVTNNRMSAGAFQVLRELADPPALLATDDDLWTRLVTPSVSVVQQPIHATGRAAGRLLGQRIADPDEVPSSLLLRSKVVPRDSTARRG